MRSSESRSGTPRGSETVTIRSNSQKSLAGSAIPCSCARLQRMSEATEPPRCVWSSASPPSNTGAESTERPLCREMWPDEVVDLLARGATFDAPDDLVLLDEDQSRYLGDVEPADDRRMPVGVDVDDA